MVVCPYYTIKPRQSAQSSLPSVFVGELASLVERHRIGAVGALSEGPFVGIHLERLGPGRIGVVNDDPQDLGPGVGEIVYACGEVSGVRICRTI